MGNSQTHSLVRNGHRHFNHEVTRVAFDVLPVGANTWVGDYKRDNF